MNTILEIGCGEYPGPRFEGAGVHYTIDSNPEVIRSIKNYNNDFDVLCADARSLLEFDDDSVDVVLARNVFGDPVLGTKDERRLIVATLAGIPDSKTAKGLLDDKYRIIEAAGRVLRPEGRLVIVEQYSSMVAKEFFQRLPKGLGGLAISEAKLSDVAPQNYVEYFSRVDTKAWVGIKP